MRSSAGTITVAGAYGAQGLGYAIAVTVLPEFKSRLDLTETTIALLLLGMCAAAAGGSILADLIAVRWGSKQALCAGLAMEAAALLTLTVLGDLGPFLVAFGIYGIGLGVVDAAANMQGALVQRRSGTPVFGRLYATYTAAAVLGAVVVSAAVAGGFPLLPLAVAATVQIAVVAAGAKLFDPARAARKIHEDNTVRTPLPWPGIWRVGALVLAAFTVDSAVATWSTVYLSDGLAVAAATAPLGFAAYQAAVLVSRLTVDPLVRRFDRSAVTAAAIGIGVLGTATVAVVPTLLGAIIGFAAAGLSIGALVPIAFSAAGELEPARSDEVIARVNLFNYGGAVAGAVALGLVATGPSLGTAFIIPAVVLLAVVPTLPRHTFTRSSRV
ncbi:MFS transporter [Nocardia sp. NPDC058176]|uniref:MFS transporter n=1 Tax=Nocardia sp. NPDC058176 TaxID=3346368 RepID=UPI0036D8CCAF